MIPIHASKRSRQASVEPVVHQALLIQNTTSLPQLRVSQNIAQKSQLIQQQQADAAANNDYRDTPNKSKISLETPVMGHEKDTEISPPRMRSTMNRPSVDKLSGLITKNMNPNPPIQKNQPLTVQNSNSNPVLTNQKKYVFDKNNMLNGQLYSQVNISAMSIPLSNSSTSRKK